MLNDPRTMKRDEIIKFFAHIHTREASHGVEDAFRFKSVLSSRKKGSLQDAMYSNRESSTSRDMASPSQAPAPASTPAPSQVPATGTTPAPSQGPAMATTRATSQLLAPGQLPVPGRLPVPDTYSFYSNSFQSTSNLTLDRRFEIDPHIELDESLDPDIMMN